MARWIVREIAERQGLNAHKLAMRAELSYNTVRPIWLGTVKQVHLETLAKLAEALGVHPRDLIGNGEGEVVTGDGILKPVAVPVWTTEPLPALG